MATSRIRALGQLIKGLYLSSSPALSDGQEHPMTLDATGALRVTSGSSSSTSSTYQTSFQGLVCPVGQFFELIGGNAIVGRVREIYFYKPSVNMELTVTMQSVATTGGTSSAGTSTKHDLNNAAATLTSKLYTVAPTPGTSAGKVIDVKPVTSGDILGFTFGDTSSDQMLTIRNGQSLVFSTDVIVTVYGYIIWTEAAS